MAAPGTGPAFDYRGVPVLSAWTPLPPLRAGLVVKMDEVEAQQATHRLTRYTLQVALGALLGALGLALLVAATISEPVATLTRATQAMTDGDLTVRAKRSQIAELDALATSFNDMVGHLERTEQEATGRKWLEHHREQLTDRMRGQMDLRRLADGVVSYLAEALGAPVGALHLLGDDGQLRCVGSCALAQRQVVVVHARGEGLVGQCAADGRPRMLEDLPDHYLTVASSLGECSPNHVVLVPFRRDGLVRCVIELGSLTPFEQRHLDLLENVGEAVAISLGSAQAQTRLSEALDESQRMGEELQTQQEELASSNEMLHEQATTLQHSEEHLRAQQEELRVANEALAAQNEQLERRTLEVERSRQALEEHAEALRTASRYKSEFLANMSHELRTPLNSLLLLARNLSDNPEGNLSAEQLQASQVIYSSGTDLLNLINEILDLSKIEAGFLELRIEPVALADVADRMRRQFAHLFAEKGLELRIELAADLPATLTTDSKRLDQVLKNLLSNALKFTDAGHIRLFMEREGETPSGRVKFGVQDTGIGIAKGDHELVFEAFQQVDGTATRKYGGTGLGLSISRELVHLLGGKLELVSEPGHGTTFHFTLPAGPPPADSPTPSRPRRASAPTPAPPPVVIDDRESLADGERVVLVIEDDLSFAGALRERCHRLGVQALIAPTGEDGLALAHRYHPQGILLDLGLPGADGWKILQLLKDDPATRHIPVHIASAEDEVPVGQQRGAIGFLRKPATGEQLDATIEQLLVRAAPGRRQLLVVEDEEATRLGIVELLSGHDVQIVEATDGAQAQAALRAQRFECMILDLGLRDTDGLQLLRDLHADSSLEVPPVIVYTARELTRGETEVLREWSDSIILKDVRSEERLLDEASLFLHRVVADMPPKKRQVIRDSVRYRRRAAWQDRAHR